MKLFDPSFAADTDYLVEFAIRATALACETAFESSASSHAMAVRSQAMTLYLMQQSPKLLPPDERDDFASAFFEGQMPRAPISLGDLQTVLRGRIEWPAPRLDALTSDVMGDFIEHPVRGTTTTVGDVINFVIGFNSNKRFAAPAKWGIGVEAEIPVQRFGPRKPEGPGNDGISRPEEGASPGERAEADVRLEGRMEDLIAVLRKRAHDMLDPMSDDRASVAPRYPALLLAISHTIEFRWTTALDSDINHGQHSDKVWSGFVKEALSVVMPDITDDARSQYAKRAVERGYLPSAVEDGGTPHG